MEILFLLCGLLFLAGVIGLGSLVLLLKLGVIARYWTTSEPDTIDAEYTLDQQQDLD